MKNCAKDTRFSKTGNSHNDYDNYLFATFNILA